MSSAAAEAKERQLRNTVAPNGHVNYNWLDVAISTVPSAVSPNPASSTTVRDVLKGIHSGRWKLAVERVRDSYIRGFMSGGTEQAKAAVRKLKSTSLVAAMFSGSFTRHADSALTSHSGLLCVDLDDIGSGNKQLKDKLRNDPHVLAYFASPTLTGLKVLVRIEALKGTTADIKQQHEQIFLAAQKYFKDVYALSIDEACKDVARLCFVSFDKDIYVRRSDAKILLAEQAQAQAPKPALTDQIRPKQAKGWAHRFKGDLSTLDIVGLLQDLGVKTKESGEGGKYSIECPWTAKHSDNGSSLNTSTVVWRQSGGQSWPGFKCQHAHCADRGLKDLLDKAESRSRGIVDRHCSRMFGAKHAAQAEPEPQPDCLDGLMLLPKSEFTTYSESAETIFRKLMERKPPKMFIRSSNIVLLKGAGGRREQAYIEDVTTQEFCTEVEKIGRVFTWGKDQHGNKILRAKQLMAEREARIIMAASERFALPPIEMVHAAPLLIERDGKAVIMEAGYNPDLGGRYIANDIRVEIVPLNEAVRRLLDLISEFNFVTESDRARAAAAIITPALRFGGLLQCHFPIILVEADRPQAGKGTLIELIQRLYGELSSKRNGGVGSFDEDLSRQMLRGRPFIQIDNVREALDSQMFESALTCPFGATVSVRVPYRGGVSIDPNRHIFHLTSNKFESTQDLAMRSCVVRLTKRDKYKWKKFDGRGLLAHVETNLSEALSIVYTIASHWVNRGKPQNEDELRGEGRFRDWWQVADWLAKEVFGLPSPLDGHEKIQSRVASAGQTWARAIGNVLKAKGQLGKEFSAIQLVEIAEAADDVDNAKIPGAHEKADESSKAKRVGSLMAQLFRTSNEAEVDIFKVTRNERDEYRDESRAYRPKKYYVFELLGVTKSEPSGVSSEEDWGDFTRSLQ